MGKVVKSARFVERKYVVSVPGADAPTNGVSNGISNGVSNGEYDDAFSLNVAAPSTNGYHEPEPLREYEAEAPPALQVDWEALRADAEAIVDRAASDAESLLKQAETTALELVANAQARVAEIEEAARASGHAEGFARGHDEAIAEFEPVVRTLREWIDGIREQRDALISSAEPELVRLAMAIAERIVHTEVSENRQVVVENVRAALTRLVTREVVTLRVNPMDHETIRQYRDSIVEASDVEHLRIVEDQRVDRGGVLVETDAGTIDAKIATQLREAKRAILTDDAIALDTAEEHEMLAPSATI
jgi:flagellar biosynthesis/type III secretory pathway protein FliH